MVKEQWRDGVKRKTGIRGRLRLRFLPATQKDASDQTTNKEEVAPCLDGFTVHWFVVCNVCWLQGKHMIGRGVKILRWGNDTYNYTVKTKRGTDDLPHCHWQRSGHYPPDSSSARKSSTGYFLLSHYCGSAQHKHTQTQRGYFLCRCNSTRQRALGKVLQYL